MYSFRRFANSILKYNKATSRIQIQGQRSIKKYVAPTLKEFQRRKERMGPQPIPRRSTFLEWNHNAELYAFGKRLNEEFNEKLLLSAFTEKSYIFQEEQKQKELGIESPALGLTDNEHLAEIGTKLLKEYIPAYIKKAWPTFPEKGIIGITEHLLSEETLAHISLNLGTKDLILSTDFPVTTPSLAKTFKAIIGALVESTDQARACLFIRDFVLTQLTEDFDFNKCIPISDPIREATEILGCEPEARLIGSCGVNTLEAVYRVGLYVNKKFVGSGFGDSIEEAKDMAARDVLIRHWGSQENKLPPLPLLEDISIQKLITN